MIPRFGESDANRKRDLMEGLLISTGLCALVRPGATKMREQHRRPYLRHQGLGESQLRSVHLEAMPREDGRIVSKLTLEACGDDAVRVERQQVC